MSKKYLHVKDGRVVAITLEGEIVPAYGEVHEVPLDAKVGVGDSFEAPAAEPVEAPKPVKGKKAE